MKLLAKHVSLVITVLSILGLAIAIYSFLHNQSFASGEFCTIGETFNCDIVNKGAYSTMFGIPVSVMGIIGYLFLGITSVMCFANFNDRLLRWFLTGLAVGGLAFSLYLTSIEAFVLHTWCLLCLTSQFLMAGIALSVVIIWYNDRGKNKSTILPESNNK